MTIHGHSRPIRFTSSEIRSLDEVPIVTIFGAGVAGLSLAHELVERGFGVQVVEAEPHPDREYAIRVGGLAANQYGRIPAELERLHPYLFSDDGRGSDDSLPIADRKVLLWLGPNPSPHEQWIFVDDQPPLSFPANPTPATVQGAIAALHGIDATLGPDPRSVSITSVGPWANRRLPIVTALEKQGTGFVPSTLILVESPNSLIELRAGDLKPVQHRYPIPQQIQFERRPAVSWPQIVDDHGIPNSTKLRIIARLLDAAYRTYEEALAQELASKPSLVEKLSERMRRREAFWIEICGHTDGDDTPENNRSTSRLWATDVRTQLIAELTAIGSPLAATFTEHSAVVGLGDLHPIDNPRRARGRRACNRVELRIVERVIPGEHGYRYFPRFYRNLFDTMRRTPILDADGNETGETAFDRLVPTRAVDLASKPPREGPIAVPIRTPMSLEAFRNLISRLLEREELRVPSRDVMRFVARMVRYATSGETRRRDYEKETWGEFIRIADYGKEMRALLSVTPEALVGMNAEETDARTQGTVLMQLLLDMSTADSITNATLDGPTSEAWLEDWKRYLSRQGVRFFRGSLTRLVWKGSTLLPLTTIDREHAYRVLVSVQDEGLLGLRIGTTAISPTVPPGVNRIDHVVSEITRIGYSVVRIGALPILAITRSAESTPIEVATTGTGVRVVGVEPEIAEQDYSAPSWFDALDGGPDFYVLAVPYLEASRLVWDAKANAPVGAVLDGCLAQLMRFDEESGRANGTPTEPDRDGWGRPRNVQEKTWPLRDLSGVQFYFDRETRVGSAHSYYLDANWGLSSISQVAYWRERRGRESAFLGQLSVDLGRWYWHGEGVRSSAWRTSRAEIAKEVWSQIESRLEPFPPRKNGDAVERIRPAYYHVDEAIRFDDATGLHFSRARISISGADPAPIALTVQGQPVSVTSVNALAGAVEAASDCAAMLVGAELVIGPQAGARGKDEESMFLVFDEAKVGTVYRVRIHGSSVQTPSSNGDVLESAEVLVDLLKSIGGVMPKLVASGKGKAVQIKLTLDPAFPVSVVAHDPTDPDAVRLWMYPTGVVKVLPDEMQRTQWKNPREATPARNAAPFLINAAGTCPAGTSTWSMRPGHAVDPGSPRSSQGHGSKGRILYAPSRRRWLMVGNHMATWTRLSTMESANESARHAATAIIHEVLRKEKPEDGTLAAARSAHEVVGDLPVVWNPEEHEIDDAAPLKRLDERLAKEGLPHFMDILGVDEWIDGDSKAIRAFLQAGDLGAKIKGLLAGSIEGVSEDWTDIVEAVGNSLRILIGSRAGSYSDPEHGN